MTKLANQTLETNRRPASPLAVGRPFERAVHAQACIPGGGRSALRSASKASRIMWTCPKCNESIDDQFDSCWKCAGQLPPSVTEVENDLPLRPEDKAGSPLWSVLSLACPICAIGLALLVLLPRRPGSGNIQIFPEGFVLVVLSILGGGIAGVVFGLIGLIKGRWPIIAFVGILLSGWLLWGICGRH